MPSICPPGPDSGGRIGGRIRSYVSVEIHESPRIVEDDDVAAKGAKLGWKACPIAPEFVGQAAY